MNPSSSQPEDVACPKCGSVRIHAEKRGWSIWIGFIGSSQIVVTCLKCGHKFKPGEGVSPPVAAAVPAPVIKTSPPDDDSTGIPTYKLD